MPRQGFYVVVPPQYLAWGAPPPPWYIDDLMRHEGSPYYVGLLKAAELHGATHQAVMEFQIVTNKRLPQLSIGRSTIAFYYRKDFDPIAAGIGEQKTDTGHMKASSPELTALDLLRYPHAGGGLDNIATVIADLAERLDAVTLAALAGAYDLYVPPSFFEYFKVKQKLCTIDFNARWSRLPSLARRARVALLKVGSDCMFNPSGRFMLSLRSQSE